MNYSLFHFTLNIQSNNPQISVPVVNKDTGRRFYINFSDGGDPYIIAKGCSAYFAADPPTGPSILEECVIEDESVIRYDFSANTAATVGKYDCEIRLYGANGKLITSPQFIILVTDRAVDDSDIDVLPAQQSAIDAMLSAETGRRSAEANRVVAEANRVVAEEQRNADFNDQISRVSEVADELEQKLADGDFKGKDGKSVTHSWNGTILTIESASGKDSVDLKGKDGNDGKSGVYVGSGEMPEGYNVQIDPDGDPFDFGDFPYPLSEKDKNEIASMVEPGESAYDIAVANGFDGTEEEWLASLKGDPYNLTATDKTEMVNLVLAALPTWQGGSY